MAPAPSSDSASATIISSRGIGVAASGLLITILGVGLASPALVYAGVTMIAAITVAGLWMVLSIHTFLLRFPVARREVVPRPLTAGISGRVTVSIGSAGARSVGTSRSLGFSRAMIEGLDIREQAASELTGGMGTKATVTRTSESLTLSYAHYVLQCAGCF